MVISFVAFCALAVIVCAAFGRHTNAVLSQMSESEVRNQLLLDTVDQMGMESPEEAARLWANGIVMRNAAMQYSAMNAELKQVYRAQLELYAPDWVTGVSSPWVDGYQLDSGPGDASKQEITVYFQLMSSNGEGDVLRAELTLEREEAGWLISEINAEEALFPYTRYR